MKKNHLTRAVALLMVLVLSVSMTACGTKKSETDTTTQQSAAATADNAELAAQPTYTAKPGSVKKTETVYINADYYGTPENVIVSDWLHTDKPEVQVTDSSDLTDIENAKGYEIPVMNGSSLTWNMRTTDLYYRGKSDKALPVSIGVQYFLNDKQVAVEELAGQSGKVTMKIHVQNNLSVTKTIEGKAVTVYNPILVVGGMILSESQFTNITVDNGKAIGDGAKQIVVLASMPGVSETLGLTDFGVDADTLKFPTDFTVTMDATDFTLGNLYFAAIPFSNLNATFEMPSTVSDLESSISQISGIVDSVYAMNPEALIKMLKENKNGLNELVDAIGDAAKLYEDNKKLIAVLQKYLTKENVEALEKLVKDLDETDLEKYQELLSNPLFKSFFKDLPKLADDLETMMPVIEALNKDLADPAVQASLDKLPETLKQLSAVIDTVEENQELIDALLKLMSEDNLTQINKIIKAVEAADISSMITDYTKLADNAEAVIARFQAMLDYGNTYRIFTAAAKGTETSTMFVFQTPGITKATVSIDTVKQAGLAKAEEKKGLWDTIQSWFQK